MKRAILPLTMIGLLGACADQPLAPELGTLDEAQMDVVASSALDETDARLLTFEVVMRMAHRAFREQGGNEAAEALLAEAREARIAARGAREEGDLEGARALWGEARRLTLGAVVAILGDDIIQEAIAGARATIHRLEARIGDRDVPTRVRVVLERSAALLREAESVDDPVTSLSAALRASELLRSLSQLHVARRAIHEASVALREAIHATDGTATEAEVASLRRARRLIGRAGEALDAHEFRLAIRAARAALELAQGVLDGRSG